MPTFPHLRRLLCFTLAVATTATTVSLRAFSLSGRSWPDGDIPMVLSLGAAPSGPLLDGSPDFNAVAEAALAEWNQHLTRSKFTSTRNQDAERRDGNRVNNVFFDTTQYGMSFGQNTLAVTLTRFNSSRRSIESDVIFNSALTWNSYRGPWRGNTRDFRRVALHEFGHVLGLDHPDKASPPQNISAVMNSIAGDTEGLQADDIAGGRALYDPGAGQAPIITSHPQSRTARVGERVTFGISATGSGGLTYTWIHIPLGGTLERDGEEIRLTSGPTLTIGSVQPVDAGTYRCVVTGPGGNIVVSNAAALSVTPLSTTTDTTLANISTRGVVGTGSNVLIAGFVVGGSTPKNVLVRAAGPALGALGVGGTLSDPVLRVVNSSGQTVAENDNWPSALQTNFQQVGGFAFPANSRDAALLLTNLAPGSYTATVSGANNTTGISLVEVYDADPDPATKRSRRLVNIATRGQVLSGENVIIAGLVVDGPGPRTYLIRAIGPTLLRAPFNISNAMRDPFLQIFRGDTLLRENDDWDAPESGMPALRDASQRVGAFPMTETRDNSGLDAAMLMTLEPGAYTAKVSGFEGSTGIALIEIYEVP